MDFVGRGLVRFRAVSVPVTKRQGGGARGTCAPSSQMFFIVMQFLAKIMPGNRLVPSFGVGVHCRKTLIRH